MKTFDQFEKIAKKKKKKNLIVTVMVTLMSLGVLFIGTKMIFGRIIHDKGWEVVHTMENLEAVAFPNSNTYRWRANGGDLLHGGIKGARAKDIYGVPVYHSEYETNFSIFGINWGNSELHGRGTHYGNGLYQLKTGQKVPQFYNINVKPSEGEAFFKPTQEISDLKEMTGQLVEVAITFDKPYTLSEIESMIPDNLKTNWYWIGTKSTGDPSTWSDDSLFGTGPEGFTREEYLDPKAVDKAMADVTQNGEKLDKSITKTKTVEAFFSNLKALLRAPGDATYNNTRPRDDVEAYLKTFGHLDLTDKNHRNQLEFSGIILTGPAENFAQLENASWIYASSIGASTPNQPYYQLDKE
ncbi:anti sigma factor C-terminal domain-containing protein [Streptococcus merionis]|uniref:anti sigma factor C-terminal domain-containing protein n=1 Tax=Streptococcus merionis TaxID=400065 RepID=UPI0035115FBC